MFVNTTLYLFKYNIMCFIMSILIRVGYSEQYQTKQPYFKNKLLYAMCTIYIL